jgi:ubiquitin-like-conjugating enzyme ATG3
MEDIFSDYAHKTVTMETHPFSGITCASIHPCHHADTMKRIIDNIKENQRTPRVEYYLFYFLKFISSVIPTIEYDYTMDVSN